MSSPEAVPKEGESEDWDTTVTKPCAGPQMRSTKHFGQNATKPSIWVLSKLHMITFDLLYDYLVLKETRLSKNEKSINSVSNMHHSDPVHKVRKSVYIKTIFI